MEPAAAEPGLAPAALLTVRGLEKRFDGVPALRGATVMIAPGERHALIGENGAGKSTLIKIVSGSLQADAGEIALDGRPFSPGSPAAARRSGIAVVHQELSIIPELSVAENVLLGDMPTRAFGRIDWTEMRRRAKAALDRLGLTLPVDQPASGLPIALQQMVEIARAIAGEARLLIMDEPTSSLGPREAAQLWATVGDLARQGIAVLFVSHKLDEVLANAERVTVLRDGMTVATLAAREADVKRLVTLMVGREMVDARAEPRASFGPVVLSARQLTRRGAFEGVHIEVREGEIVGLAGLVGAGRTEVVRAIFGADPRDAGEVLVGGQTLPAADPRSAIAAGIGFVPESRKSQGIFANMGVGENIVTPGPRRHALAWLRVAEERGVAGEAVAKLGVVTASLEQGIATLSGGNQQKAILGRWLALDPRLLIIDEPTRGIDVGAKEEIYALIRRHAGRGRAVLMVSSEIPELLALCDRIVVMRGGRVAGTLTAAGASEAAIGNLALGVGHG